MRALVLLSGGMDSTTALAQAVDGGANYVECISFNYGQRHSKELLSAAKVAEHYGVTHHIIDLTGASAAFAGSALTGGGPVPEGHYAADNMKQTVVPNRNMIMMSLAAGLAISRDLDEVWCAAHAGDHDIYPDCRGEFFSALEEAIQVGNYKQIKVVTPFILKTKAEIASRGFALRAPLSLTWSCYKGEITHCGRCGTCVERREAFHLADVPDPTEYEDKTDFWKKTTEK